MADYGVITEQGDMGLGFNPVSKDEEKQILREYCEKDEDEEEE